MLEFLNYLWIFISIPVGLIYNKINNHEGRISATEAKQEIYEKKVDKMCNSTDDLTKEVHEMIGKLDLHLSNSRT